MDISFLNELFDREKIEMESSWFKAHPETGCFWLHSLYGPLKSHLTQTSAERIAKAKESDIDGLKPLVAALHKYVSEGCKRLLLFTFTAQPAKIEQVRRPRAI